MPDIPILQQLRRHAESAMRRASDDYQSAKAILSEIDDAIVAECQKRSVTIPKLILVGTLLFVVSGIIYSLGW